MPAATCLAANGPPQGNRRDFVITDPLLFGFVHTFEVTQETIVPVHRPLRLLLHNAPLPTTVFKARRPMDPIPHLAHDLSSEEGASHFKCAQAESFAAQDEFLTQAALLKDTSALWKLWSAAMEQAYLACLQPQALAKHGVNYFTGHGLTRIQEKILLPPKPRLVGRDHVADTHASPRGDKARKLARAARMLWLQLQKKSTETPAMRNKPPLPCPWEVAVAPPARPPLQRVRATEPQRGGSEWLDLPWHLMLRRAHLSPPP